MGTVRFTLRTDKQLKTGQSPIELIYQVSGQRKYYRTDKKLFPENWDAHKQNAIYLDKKATKKLLPGIDFDLMPSTQDISNLNFDLSDLKMDIMRIQKGFEIAKVPYSSQMVIDKLKELKGGKTKKEVANNVLFLFMHQYITDHESTREGGSLSVYKSVKRHLEDYCKATGNKVTFETIDYNFFQSFQSFLLKDHKATRVINGVPKEVTIKGLNNTTVAKQLSTIKTFLNYARLRGVVVSDKYKDFKIKRENLEVIALTNEEFEKLFYMDLHNNKRLAETRDVFCFSSTTGLRYSDLKQLKREHIKNNEIKLIVTKTKQPLTIPLNSFSNAILSKYAKVHSPLPVISSQNLNYAIKDLCKLAGIDELVEIVRFKGAKRESITYPKYELISIHNGRKTFATLSLEKGMSAEEVMAIGGWIDYRSFKRYVKITEKRNKVVMVKAWGEVKIQKLKAV